MIGADLGTTSTTALGSIGGHYIKRQLALAQFLFNAVVDLAAFFFLLPLLPIVMTALSLSDPLYSLVAFHSLFNLLGLLIFLPLLKPFSHWIGGRFLKADRAGQSLADQPVAVPDAALLAIERVLSIMRLDAVVLSLHAFQLRPEQLQLNGDLLSDLASHSTEHEGMDQRYRGIKQQESELISFSFDLQGQTLTSEQVSRLERQTREARALVYSSKTLNDIRENLASLRHSKQSEIIDWYKYHRSFMKRIYSHYLSLANKGVHTPVDRESLAGQFNDNEKHYRESNERVSTMASSDKVAGIELSTMLNVNGEVHHSLKNLLQSLSA